MSRIKQCLCKNREGNCPNYINSTVITIGGTEKFECPLHLANCETEHLEEVALPEPPWKRLVKKMVLVALPLVCVALAWWYVRGHQPPPPPPAKTSVVVVIDGHLLNAVMVRTPGWLAEQAGSLTNSQVLLSFGLWGCRPIEPDGEIRLPFRNYVPKLLPLADFRNLQIPSGPKPDVWPEALRRGSPSYDLLSNLKSVLQETLWESSTNRLLLIITESSAFPSSSEKNSARIDEQQVRKLADDANVRICAIHVLVPNDMMKEDQGIAEQQLRVLSANGNRPSYFPVYKSVDKDPAKSDSELVSAYEDGIKAAFSQILDQTVKNRGPQ